MQKNSKEYLAELAQRDLSQELNCVNALQRTAWRINENVVKVIRTVWDSGQEWAGLPPRDDLDLPAYPFGDTELSDLPPERKPEVIEFLNKRTAIHKFNGKSRSKRIQIERTIQIAEDYMKYNEFYFVWQLDFRGRKYPVESFMSPQVADWGKATIEFAEVCGLVALRTLSGLLFTELIPLGMIRYPWMTVSFGHTYIKKMSLRQSKTHTITFGGQRQTSHSNSWHGSTNGTVTFRKVKTL